MGRLASKVGARNASRESSPRGIRAKFTPRLNHVRISQAPFNIQQLHGIAEHGVVALGHHQRGNIDDVPRFQHGEEFGIHTSVIDAVHQDVGARSQRRLCGSEFGRVHCDTDAESMASAIATSTSPA